MWPKPSLETKRMHYMCLSLVLEASKPAHLTAVEKQIIFLRVKF